MKLLYNISINLYTSLIYIASIFNKKAKLWVNGRKDIFMKLEKAIPKNTKTAWFHVSSLGEFEQGRPLIEAFKKQYPKHKILITFFSPSGYEIRKNYEQADYIFYLPTDTKRNAKRFINIVNPDVVFWIKYDFWYHYINTLKRKRVPTFLISAIFRNDQLFFKQYGKWYKTILETFEHIFVQNESSRKILEDAGIKNVTVSGDTRFDRVYQISQQAKSFPIVEKFKQDKQIFIAGSSWPKDEELIVRYINTSANRNIKYIIAPHEIKKENIDRIANSINTNLIRYSEANQDNAANAQILIIDNIGMLSSLYQYADIAYIGGGFGKSIHNTQEPAIWGVPVIFGPKNHHKFREAVDLINMGAAFCIHNYDEFNNIVTELIDNHKKREKCSDISKQYMQSMIGATDIIIKNSPFNS